MLRTPINENSSLPGTFAIEYISKNPNNGYIHTKTKTVFVADSTTYTIDIFDIDGSQIAKELIGNTNRYIKLENALTNEDILKYYEFSGQEFDVKDSNGNSVNEQVIVTHSYHSIIDTLGNSSEEILYQYQNNNLLQGKYDNRIKYNLSKEKIYLINGGIYPNLSEIQSFDYSNSSLNLERFKNEQFSWFKINYTIIKGDNTIGLNFDRIILFIDDVRPSQISINPYPEQIPLGANYDETLITAIDINNVTFKDNIWTIQKSVDDTNSSEYIGFDFPKFIADGTGYETPEGQLAPSIDTSISGIWKVRYIVAANYLGNLPNIQNAKPKNYIPLPDSTQDEKDNNYYILKKQVTVAIQDNIAPNIYFNSININFGSDGNIKTETTDANSGILNDRIVIILPSDYSDVKSLSDLVSISSYNNGIENNSTAEISIWDNTDYYNDNQLLTVSTKFIPNGGFYVENPVTTGESWRQIIGTDFSDNLNQSLDKNIFFQLGNEISDDKYYSIEYKVADPSGNEFIRTRKLYILDLHNPDITLTSQENPNNNTANITDLTFDIDVQLNLSFNTNANYDDNFDIDNQNITIDTLDQTNTNYNNDIDLIPTVDFSKPYQVFKLKYNIGTNQFYLTDIYDVTISLNSNSGIGIYPLSDNDRNNIWFDLSDSSLKDFSNYLTANNLPNNQNVFDLRRLRLTDSQYDRPWSNFYLNSQYTPNGTLHSNMKHIVNSSPTTNTATNGGGDGNGNKLVLCLVKDSTDTSPVHPISGTPNFGVWDTSVDAVFSFSWTATF